MIVRCPECSTGFKLPKDRVGPKGAKVRCTKCDHVFRVRITNDEPEIFYKPGEEPAKSPSFSDFGNRTAFGGPNSMAEDQADNSDLRESGGHTAIGRPGDLPNLRSTPRQPLSAVTPEVAQAAAPPMAAGIISKKKIRRHEEEDDDDTAFAGPGAAISEPEDDSTSIGKPVEPKYSPKATSFGLPALGAAGEPMPEDPFAADEDPFADEDDNDADTNFGFPASKVPDASPAFGKPVEEDEEEDLRGTAFGRPAFQEAPDQAPEDPTFGDDPKGTLFGLPAIGDNDDEPEEDDGGDLDLFAGQIDEPDDQLDDDPFAGAFEDKIDTSAGTGIEVDPALTDDEFAFGDDTTRADPPAFSDDDKAFEDAFAADPEPDASPEDDMGFFSGGGGGSDFGDAAELVDPSFGTDGPSFDPDAGEPVEPAYDDSFDFDDGSGAGDVDLVMETTPPPAAEKELKKSKKKKAKAAKAALPTAAPASAGIVQKTMNLVLIVVLVIAGLVGFIASKTGGVVDFGRFDHMLEIVFDGKDFQPRPEWGLETRTADEIVPLQASNVTGVLAKAKDGEPFVVRGKVENLGSTSFSGVKLNVALVGADGAILVEKTVPAGTKLEARKLKQTKLEDSDDIVIRQMSTMEPNSELPFVAIFDELPVGSVEDLEILVDVAEKAEIPKKEE